MTEKFKILANYIKDLSSETADVETYLFVKENISKYHLDIDITSKALKNKLIEVNTTLKFQDKDAKGQYKVIAVRAKKMRGLMLRYMIQHQVTRPEQLLTFTENQYAICEAESSPSRLVFRSQ